jgi:hypothetical protein
MTDINELRRKAQAAREFTVQAGACSYTLRLPTRHETEVEVLRSRSDGDAALPAVLTRRLLEASLVGWSGVTHEQLAPGGGSDLAELVPGAAALLLDNDPQAAAALLEAFVAKAQERNDRLEAAEKN